ncbi:MAG: Hpt domain-containing protein [Clostridia bacterium]|nr:Hpt domain-containing protein [Clostridia bacterium]
MDEKLRAMLEEAGFEVEETFLRFLKKEDFYKKYLFGFPEDRIFPQLSQAMEKGDMEAAEKLVHTLKGTTGNLGITPLHQDCKSLLDAIRNGEEKDVITAKYQKARETYDEITRFIISIR